MRGAPLVAVLGAMLLGLAPGGAYAREDCRIGSRAIAPVDLFFGAGRSDPASWRRFLRDIVTPRFPNGLTSLDGAGQWRGPHGLAKEPTHVVVIFYDADTTSDRRIETIRTLYRQRFGQASVLRADTMACVGF